MASLKEIRARLAAQESRKQTGPSGPNPIYPHWNIEENETAIVRFLEDADENNPYFWVERLMFRLPFNGSVNMPEGAPSDRSIIVQVPCMEMYGEQDRVLNEVRTWFKDSTLEEQGRKYWKKRSYIFQGFVRSNPMADDETPDNPIRRFMISPQIFNLIKNSLMDPEIENLPTDPVNGLDFRITKTMKGNYGDYTSSSWARKESALTDEELEALQTHGLFNLADFLPAKPTEEQQNLIYEMFEASVDGEPYDYERWGAFYTPAGVARSGTDSDAPKPAAAPAPVAEAAAPKAEPVEAPAPEAAKVEEPAEEPADDKAAKAQDILKMIRERQS